MNRLLSAAIVIVLVLFSRPSSALAQAAGSVRVTAERTSVRDKPATDGAVVVGVVRGDELQILEVSGSWYRVRTSTGREGYVHNLFVERVGGAPAPAAATPAPTPAAAPSSTATSPSRRSTTSPEQGEPRFGGDGTHPMGNRRFGVGLNHIGPSIRYWMDAKKGFQVDGYFSSNFGYRVMSVSPSFIMRFQEPKEYEVVSLLPYWGAGVSLWRFDDGYNDYYCGQFNDCSSTTLGFGGFGGTGIVFKAVPKLALSGTAGFYSSALGFGGFGIWAGVHYYP